MRGLNLLSLTAGIVVAVMCLLARKVSWRKAESINIGIHNPYTKDKKSTVKITGYERVVKPIIDRILSFIGLIILSPVLGIIALLVVVDDPGNVFFTQKRVGINGSYFVLHKFRTMRISTPHDVPTHELKNPEQYITRIGRILRKTSLDELPQIWDIFRGKMSIIGPRPALWNQDDLVAEREKWDANSVLPGLTGFAQISGRDKLKIPVKAKIDGEYVKILRRSSFHGFFMDMYCFFGTVLSVLRHDGVVEGGTESFAELPNDFHMKITRKVTPAVRFQLRSGVPKEDPPVDWGYLKHFTINWETEKKVLITGAKSYIGESFNTYVSRYYGSNFDIRTIDMEDESWKEFDFSGYDTVFHVAGIAHADVGSVSAKEQENYYKVNTDLAIETAKVAKAAGVSQFIFMSSIIIYGGAEYIDEYTVPVPGCFYSDSKWQADQGVRALGDERFKVAVLRPPMIYGRKCKGNYQYLSKIAKIFPLFPKVDNCRSMLYVENLCEFLSRLILSGEGGVYVPQNGEYSNTSDLVLMIGTVAGKKVRICEGLTPAVTIVLHALGKIGNLARKAFGSSWYDQKLSQYEGLDYQKYGLRESVERTEGGSGVHSKDTDRESGKPHILVVTQYFYPEAFRINDIASEWVKRGYKITVLTGIPNYPMGRFFEGYDYKHGRREYWKGMKIIRIPLIPRGSSSIGMLLNYFSFIMSGWWWKSTNDIKADLVFSFEVSPMTQALIGCWYKKKYKVPHYLYVQDLWPENVEIVGGVKNKAVLRLLDKMVDYIYVHTDQIFTASPSFVEKIVRRKKPVKSEKVHYWPQYAEEFYVPMDKEYVRRLGGVYDLIPDDNSFKIVFTGNIGTAQGLEILPKVAEKLKDSSMFFDSHEIRAVHFVIIGDGRYQERFEKEVDNRDVRDYFTMISRQPAENIPGLLSLCDAAFLSFNNMSLWKMTIPAKLQSYMACGMIIIASAAGETKRIVDEAGCGICIPTGDCVALVEAIQKLMRSDDMELMRMRRNSREYCKKNFNKKVLMDDMDKMIAKEGIHNNYFVV